MQEKPKRRWLQFSLKGLMVAVLVVGAGLGLFVRWWTAPIVVRLYHRNGTISTEIWERRNRRGGTEQVTEIWYYSNGQKSVELWHYGTRARMWSPTGEPVIDKVDGEKYRLADNGDGTFRKPDNQP